MTTKTFTHPDLGADGLTALLAKAGFDVGPPAAVRRTVLDTFDGRLHGAGLQLEVREVKGRELVLADRSTTARAAVSAVPSWAADLPDGPLRARLAPILDIRALLPLLTVSARRTVAVRRDRAGKTQVGIVVDDQLTVGGTDVVPPGWVVAVDELEGYSRAARQARALLVSLGMRPCDADVVDLAAATARVDLGGVSGSPTVPLDSSEPAADGFRRVLANLADAVDANWAGTVEDIDTEFLHDLRVAVRRTRSVLAEARRVVPTEDRSRFRAGFGWLGSATGPARDFDVYVLEWAGYIEPLGPGAAGVLQPVLEHIAERRRVEHVALAEVLRSDRYRDLMTGWRGWLDARWAGTAGRDAGRAVGRVVATRVAAAQKQLLARGRAIAPSSPAEDLHELRKDAKKLRYLLECFGGLLPAAPRKAFVQRLKALQDNLGEYQDTEVHSAQLRGISRELHDNAGIGADTLLAMGQLTEHFERRRQAARHEFAARFAAYDDKKTRQALEALLQSAVSR